MKKMVIFAGLMLLLAGMAGFGSLASQQQTERPKARQPKEKTTKSI